jgi:hypothetical protein
MSEGAQTASHSDGGSGGDRANVLQDWLGDLRKLVPRLGEMVISYEGKPRNIDSSLDATEKMIGSINENVRNLCDKGRTLLSEDTWQAFKGEEDEYARFYKTVWIALDTYRDDLAAYKLVGSGARPPPGRNDFPQVDQNAKLFAERRWECIEALRDLCGILSAMLDFLTE